MNSVYNTICPLIERDNGVASFKQSHHQRPTDTTAGTRNQDTTGLGLNGLDDRLGAPQKLFTLFR